MRLTVRCRGLGQAPTPPVRAGRTDEQQAALALAATLTDELVAADAQARHHGRALSAALPDALAA